MRLIDADALAKEDICEHCHHKKVGCLYTCGKHGYGEHAIWRTIDDATTIDAVPVVRGHWIPRNEMIREPFGKNYDCSVCGVNNIQYNFCPNCGADMRGE